MDLLPTPHSVCPRCGISKSAEAFPPTYGAGKFPRRRMCLECRNASDRDKHARWEEAHPEEALERYRRYYLANNESRRARWHNDPVYKERNRQAVNRYRGRNRELLANKSRERWRSIRTAVISKYGGCCACCKEQHYEFLAVDHVKGGGTRARKIDSASTSLLYRRLFKTNECLPDFRILCHNCNQAYGLYGYCPHATIADPEDGGMLDVCGFDTATPALIADFVGGGAVTIPGEPE